MQCFYRNPVWLSEIISFWFCASFVKDILETWGIRERLKFTFRPSQISNLKVKVTGPKLWSISGFSSADRSGSSHQFSTRIVCLQLNSSGNILTFSLEWSDIGLFKGYRGRGWRSPEQRIVGSRWMSQCNVDLPVFRGCLMHFVKGVLKYAHFPHIFGSIWFIKNKLNTKLKLLALDAEIFFVVHKICYFIPLEELRLLSISFSNTYS